jgi:exportin-2 (importin alpha re-exporter)
VSAFEDALFPVFQEILQQDVQEFLPYVFQMFSVLLELHTTTVPEPYMMLFPFLLVPVLWERPGNIHPLVRLLKAFISKGPQQVVQTDKLTELLGVFQKLLASRSNDHEGFGLLQTMVEHMDPQVLNPFMKQVFRLMFQRIQSSKTTKLVKCVLVFFFFFATKYGAPCLIQTIDSIQAKMFGMVLDRLLPEVQKVSGTIEKKICAVGITRLLCDCPEMITGEYSNFWAPVLQALLGLFELPEEPSTAGDEHFIELEETSGYQTAYSQLVFAGGKEHDPFEQIPDARLHLAQSLYKLSVAHPGKLQPLISTSLAPQASAFLQTYLTAANVQLA